MGSRSRLMLLAAVLGVSVSFPALGLAQAAGAPGSDDDGPAPSVEYADPQAEGDTGSQSAAPAPADEVPTFPDGCPFRDTKLERIV